MSSCCFHFHIFLSEKYNIKLYYHKFNHKSHQTAVYSLETMTYSSEKFCLKWNDFEQNLVSSYHDLRKDSEFSDVTLVCEGEEQIEAHKIILTSCSPFFRGYSSYEQALPPLDIYEGCHSQEPYSHS